MKYRLGDKASIFYDASTGIKILRGQEVEVSEKAQNSKKFKSAISNGFIFLVKEEQKPLSPQKTERTLEDIKNSFLSLLESKTETPDLIKKFNLSELTKLAESYELEAEETDTKATLAEAIINVLKTEE